MPALSDSGIRMSIAQEVFRASSMVFPVHTASLVFVGAYWEYVAICSVKIQIMLSVILGSYVALKLLTWNLSCGITGPKV